MNGPGINKKLAPVGFFLFDLTREHYGYYL